jgi:DNA-binding CsgD family transcriptional regulator
MQDITFRPGGAPHNFLPIQSHRTDGTTTHAPTLADDLQAILSRIGTGVLTTDRGLQLGFANPTAHVLLRRGDGLRLHDGRLVAYHSSDTRSLAAAIAAVTSRRTTNHERGPEPNSRDAISGVEFVSITRQQCPEAYRVTVFPLNGAPVLRGGIGGATVGLFIDDPDTANSSTTSDVDLIRRAYGLTAAEARLALLLTDGGSLTDAVATFRTTRNTVRAQLRAIFDKTQARRQADLVRRLQGFRSLRLLP